MSSIWDDAPLIEFNIRRLVKSAKKEHKCDGCNKTIAIGSSYLRYAYKQDEHFGMFKQHANPGCTMLEE